MPTARMIVPCKAVNGTLLLIPCHRRKPPTNPSGTAIHGSSSAGFGGLSFIARLYRPSFFRKAQFCRNLTFFRSLFESRLNFRFRQEKAQNQAHDENGSPHDGSCHCHLFEGGPREFRSYQVRSHKGRRGAEHSTTYIRRKTSACSSQMKRENLRQIFAEIAELRDRHKPARCHAQLKKSRFMAEEVEVSQRDHQQTGRLEKAEQGSSSQRNNQQQGQDDSSGKPPHFLPELHLVSLRFNRIVEWFLFLAVPTKLAEDLFPVDQSLLCIGLRSRQLGELPIKCRQLICERAELFAGAGFSGRVGVRIVQDALGATHG